MHPVSLKNFVRAGTNVIKGWIELTYFVAAFGCTQAFPRKITSPCASNTAGKINERTKCAGIRQFGQTGRVRATSRPVSIVFTRDRRDLRQIMPDSTDQTYGSEWQLLPQPQ